MVSLTIDGKKVEASEGKTLLEVAREHHVRIPALCHNEALTPYGACRLCMVEVSKEGRSKLVASCLYPVEQGLEISLLGVR